MLDQVSKLVDSIPEGRISDLLDESFKAFNGAGPDFQSLVDSASKLTGDINGVSDQARVLIDDVGPLLDSQAQTADEIRTPPLSGVTQQLAQNDPEVRAILQRYRFAQEVSSLLEQVKPTLPMLLANLTTVSQILVTYNPSLEQLLVICSRHHRRTAVIRPPEQQPDGSAVRRLRADHRRSAAVHGRVPSAVPVAQPCRRDGDRYT